MPRGMALTAGVNTVDRSHYKGDWKARLRAPESDAYGVALLAEANGFQVMGPLYTAEATRSRVIADIETASKALDRGDFFLFFYSGHGGQVPNRNGDEEPTGLDSTLCLYDAMVVDDELAILWARFAPGVRVLFLSDCCHSGTVFKAADAAASATATAARWDLVESTPLGVRPDSIVPRQLLRSPPGLPDKEDIAPWLPKMMTRDAAWETYDAHRAFYDEIQERIGVPFPTPVAHVLHLAACHDGQLALDGAHYSVFTSALQRSMREDRPATYLELHQRVSARSPSTQSPMLNVYGVTDGSFENAVPFHL